MIESSAQPCSNQIKRRVVISVCVQAHCSNAKELSSSTSPDTTVWCPEGSLERKLFPFSRRPVIVICVSCRIQIGVSRGLHSAGSSPARAPPSSSRLMILSFSCSTACNDTDTPTTLEPLTRLPLPSSTIVRTTRGRPSRSLVPPNRTMSKRGAMIGSTAPSISSTFCMRLPTRHCSPRCRLEQLLACRQPVARCLCQNFQCFLAT
mmetsp:Transcript_6393/g.18423  ORF Transcript_6393/g.18423 Transcript_6393/m.18423 type:complete len:206 (-) Transcript_6393:2250-2867(-)